MEISFRTKEKEKTDSVAGYSFIGFSFYLILLACTSFYLVMSCFIRFYLVILDHSKLDIVYEILQDFA